MAEIRIPATVRTIGAYSFSATELESVIIEDGSLLVTIGDGVSIQITLGYTRAHLNCSSCNVFYFVFCRHSKTVKG